jgi:hypothetical protein
MRLVNSSEFTFHLAQAWSPNGVDRITVRAASLTEAEDRLRAARLNGEPIPEHFLERERKILLQLS